MQAVLLAGGKGTRLRPYTLVFPKPLVPIGEYPILEVIIRQLCKAGVSEIIISTGHLASLIETFCGDGSRWGIPIRYVREEKPLNTAGALQLVDGLKDDFLVMNGDILTTLDYREFIAKHRQSGAMASVAVHKRDALIDYGVVEVNSSNFLDRYIEKPVYKFSVSMGIYVLTRKAVEMVSPGEAIGMPDLLLRVKAKGGGVYCHASDCSWLDIGRPDDYEKAQEVFGAQEHSFLPEGNE